MSDDPFPGAPTYEELEAKRPTVEESIAGGGHVREWYNDAVPVAARLMVEAAREHPAFRERLLGGESAHAMGEYDETRYRKLNEMGLSANQGGTAENAARAYLRQEADDD